MKDLISYSDFTKIEIRVGTIISAELNNKLRKPSYVLKIDFGDKIGIKKSSAQLTKNYTIEQMLNKQIAAVINFPKKQIGDLISEVLVLGFPDNNNEPILISPDIKLANGGRLY
jgi:tRNA-binding protein